MKDERSRARCSSGSVAMLSVEQNASVSLSIADRGCVVSACRIVVERNPADLLQHDELRKACLGR